MLYFYLHSSNPFVKVIGNLIFERNCNSVSDCLTSQMCWSNRNAMPSLVSSRFHTQVGDLETHCVRNEVSRYFLFKVSLSHNYKHLVKMSHLFAQRIVVPVLNQSRHSTFIYKRKWNFSGLGIKSSKSNFDQWFPPWKRSSKMNVSFDVGAVGALDHILWTFMDLSVTIEKEYKVTCCHYIFILNQSSLFDSSATCKYIFQTWFEMSTCPDILCSACSKYLLWSTCDRDI